MLSYTNNDTITRTHSLPSEMTQINYRSILTFITHPLLSSHTHMYPSLSKLLDSTIRSFPIESLFFFPTSIEDCAYYYLIHPFTNISMNTKLSLIRHLYVDVQINNTQKPILPNTKYCTFFSPYYPMYTPYTSLIYNMPTFHPLYKTY